ncbi:hypothetical protein T484DRAFT_2305537 [Baffinella frigidus]|nr:hypothetical protein T484DRAFT_2305537 [Cryptophyta sp. CCMP2293]
MLTCELFKLARFLLHGTLPSTLAWCGKSWYGVLLDCISCFTVRHVTVALRHPLFLSEQVGGGGSKPQTLNPGP